MPPPAEQQRLGLRVRGPSLLGDKCRQKAGDFVSTSQESVVATGKIVDDPFNCGRVVILRKVGGHPFSPTN